MMRKQSPVPTVQGQRAELRPTPQPPYGQPNEGVGMGSLAEGPVRPSRATVLRRPPWSSLAWVCRVHCVLLARAGPCGCLAAPPPPRSVVKQDKSSRGSVDTTKTRLDPQRVRMSGGAAKGKQPNTEALCQRPYPSSFQVRPPPRPRGSRVSLWSSSAGLGRVGGHKG